MLILMNKIGELKCLHYIFCCMAEKEDVPGIKSGRIGKDSPKEGEDEDDKNTGFPTVIKYGGLSVLIFSTLAFLVTFIFTPEFEFLGVYSEMGKVILSLIAMSMGAGLGILLTVFLILLKIAKSMETKGSPPS